jgi:hypothetical protein
MAWAEATESKDAKVKAFIVTEAGLLPRRE